MSYRITIYDLSDNERHGGREIYAQSFEQLDIKAIIATANGLQPRGPQVELAPPVGPLFRPNEPARGDVLPPETIIPMTVAPRPAWPRIDPIVCAADAQADAQVKAAMAVANQDGH